MSTSQVNFSNTEIAFRHKTNGQLKKAAMLFRSFNYPWLLTFGPGLAKAALLFGMKGVIKSTIFEQFCGGENIDECKNTIKSLSSAGIGTILDYSVEGEETESVFDYTCDEICRTIETAAGDEKIPFSVFKTTGILRFALLGKMSNNEVLNELEKQEWNKGVDRFEKICKKAHDLKVRLFVDAEESWIQPAIDDLTEKMMVKYNGNKAIIYNTIQLYRHDRLNYLKNQIAEQNCYLGFKLVRGAYMEKEAARAAEMGYENPIQPDKASTDRDYNEALKQCVLNINKVSLCAGTHNEESSAYLMELMNTNGLQNNDERIWFSQLLGMSDHISYNLSNAGYNVAKYVPYGPVKAVIPYLTRRAQENSSVAGQVGRELRLISEELKRRQA